MHVSKWNGFIVLILVLIWFKFMTVLGLGLETRPRLKFHKMCNLRTTFLELSRIIIWSGWAQASPLYFYLIVKDHSLVRMGESFSTSTSFTCEGSNFVQEGRKLVHFIVLDLGAFGRAVVYNWEDWELYKMCNFRTTFL